MADLADQAAGLRPDDPGRPVALSNVLLLVAEVNRMVATESLACVAPR
jgi:hypothetical protein